LECPLQSQAAGLEGGLLDMFLEKTQALFAVGQHALHPLVEVGLPSPYFGISQPGRRLGKRRLMGRSHDWLN